MKILLIVLIIYLLVSALCFIVQLLFNGTGDQSARPVKTFIKPSLKWVINLIKIIINKI